MEGGGEEEAVVVELGDVEGGAEEVMVERVVEEVEATEEVVGVDEAGVDRPNDVDREEEVMVELEVVPLELTA